MELIDNINKKLRDDLAAEAKYPLPLPVSPSMPSRS